MPAPRRMEAGTEPATSPIASDKPETKEDIGLYLYFCANPDHGLGKLFGDRTPSLKDKEAATHRAFTSPQPYDAMSGGAPVCPVCEKGVLCYPIDKKGDIPEAIQRAPY